MSLKDRAIDLESKKFRIDKCVHQNSLQAKTLMDMCTCTKGKFTPKVLLGCYFSGLSLNASGHNKSDPK